MKKQMYAVLVALCLWSSAAHAQSVHETLVRLRAVHGTVITSDQGVAILNDAAWLHRAEGFALLGKEGGSHCPQPKTQTWISCDFLIQNRSGSWFGWDVLIAAPADGEPPSSGTPNGPDGVGINMDEALANGSRSVVHAVDSTQQTPEDPIPVPSPLDARIAALETLVGQCVRDVLDLRQQVLAANAFAKSVYDQLVLFIVELQNKVAVLEGKKIPTACRASVFGIGVSCSLQ